MTLLVAVLAADGVVLGADSAATFGVMGQQTIKQSTPAKVEIVQDKALIAVSGPIGLGQRLVDELKDYLGSTKVPSDGPKVMVDLRKRFDKHIRFEWEAAQAPGKVIGPGIAAMSAASHTLLAMCVGGRPALFQFDQNGAPEEATVNLPFVCAGSGGAIGDPLLGFHRSVYWDAGKLPSMAEATFAVTWTLLEAIELAPGGFGGDINVHWLTKASPTYRARRLQDAELDEHKQAVRAARTHLKAFSEAPPAAVAPPVPSPSPKA